MSWAGKYSNIKVEYVSDGGWDLETQDFRTTINNITYMDAAQR